MKLLPLLFVPLLFVPLVLLLAAGRALAALDAEGVGIGASESEVKKRYPNAYCKPLEWTSRAAERRCDDGKSRFAGVNARVTFYLRQDAVEAFDVRFDRREADRVAATLVERYGTPALEKRAPGRLRLEWDEKPGHDKPVRAVLSASPDNHRGQLLVSRGDFADELYKVR